MQENGAIHRYLFFNSSFPYFSYILPEMQKKKNFTDENKLKIVLWFMKVSQEFTNVTHKKTSRFSTAQAKEAQKKHD